MGLFTLCSYLKTKESYDRWVTRRLWEFRHQISKAKYPKRSQNVGHKYQEASGEHCSCAWWLWNGSGESLNESQAIRRFWIGGCGCSPGERYQRIRLCLSGKVETPPLPSCIMCWMWNIRIRVEWQRQNSGCETSGEGETSQGGPSACAMCKDPFPWWHEARIAIRRHSIRISSRGHMAALPYLDSPQEKHMAIVSITPRMIAYPIRICCPDHWLKVSKPFYSPRSTALL